MGVNEWASLSFRAVYGRCLNTRAFFGTGTGSYRMTSQQSAFPSPSISHAAQPVAEISPSSPKARFSPVGCEMASLLVADPPWPTVLLRLGDNCTAYCTTPPTKHVRLGQDATAR